MAEYLSEEDMNTGEYISRDLALRQLNATCLATDCDNYNGVRCRACAYADAMDFIDAIPAADVQPVQWISCKDNMPDTSERGLSTMYSDCCLVCDAFGWVGMAYYITDGQKSWWEFADAQNKNKIDWTEVTHWMPLPEPPKDGDTNE